MTVHSLELNEILQLMASDLDSDFAFIRIDDGFLTRRKEHADDEPKSGPVYLGPFDIYDL